jgi:hypothetical protein
MAWLYKFLFLLCGLVFYTSCNNAQREIQTNSCSDKMQTAQTVQTVQHNKQKISFKDTLSLINTLKLPFDFYCGVDSFVPIEDYNSEFITNLAPKEFGVGIIGRLPSKDDKEYVIYAFPGDIIYPHLYVYDKNGQNLSSLYLHIGPCLGDENIIISNYTLIQEDYSISMIDTTKYVHYENRAKLEDSIIVTKKFLELNDDNLYVIKKEEKIVLQ